MYMYMHVSVHMHDIVHVAWDEPRCALIGTSGQCDPSDSQGRYTDSRGMLTVQEEGESGHVMSCDQQPKHHVTKYIV